MTTTVKFAIAINSIPLTEKIPQGDPLWGKYNDSFENLELEPIEIINAIYCGQAVSAWFDGRRSSDNFIKSSFIGVDMDCGDYRSSVDALTKHVLIQQYGAIIYQTPSHQSHAPKSRVMFLLDEPIKTADGYRLAIEAVYSMFDGADPACVDPSRFYYGNGSLKETQDTSGIWFSEKILMPISKLRFMTKQYLQLKLNQEDGKQRKREDVKPRTFEEQSIEEVFARLDKVDAYSLDYKEWQKVCSGLKSEFGDAAFGPAAAWSDKPGKDSLTKKYWDSLGKSGTPVTIATVFLTLREHGA